MLTLLVLWAVAGQPRAVRHSDLPPRLAGDAAQFEALVRSIEQRTAERLARGEMDHLVNFVLQSRTFTSRPQIEPALSAKEFVEKAGAAIVQRAVAARIRDFLRALRKPGADERLAYFRRLLEGREPAFDEIAAAYAEAMRFLYAKEFADPRAPSLYQERGHSSDTQVETNYAVHTALAVLKAVEPGLRIERVLLAGPGLDFAPRTEFLDFLPPQSYQPFAVADALLGLGLARLPRLEIHCVDINERVVEFLRGFAARPERRLVLLSRFADADFEAYFRNLGGNIGAETDAGNLPGRLRKAVLVRKDVAQAVTARRLNIVTERLEPPEQFDLAIATNVLVYFSNPELLLALSNIASMLRPGGCVIHNELRTEMESYGAALGLRPLQARTLRLSEGRAPLFDSFVIQRKDRAPAARGR